MTASLTVFVGPSLRHDEVRRLAPDADVRPPASRGDLYAARAAGARRMLLIDGSFTQRLAVSPREVVDVLRDGATVAGASSMGALRAAECWPAGMLGIGRVYRMYRLGVLSSDDAVAVSTDPDDGHAALSVALVNICAAVRRARGSGLIDDATAKRIEHTAGELFFSERTWRRVLHDAAVADPHGELRRFCASVDIKRSDAAQAVLTMARLTDRDAGGAGAGEPLDRFAQGPRYPGHDPLLGRGADEADAELLQWLFGSGRYQRYLWPLMVGEPEFDGLHAESDRSGAMRERLAAALARMLAEPAPLARRLGDELRFLEEYDSELMRMHAARVTAERCGAAASPHAVQAARESVAIDHGYVDWRSLASDVENERVFGAIPFSWVDRACDRIAATWPLAGRLG
jgi:hypothetical protein